MPSFKQFRSDLMIGGIVLTIFIVFMEILKTAFKITYILTIGPIYVVMILWYRSKYAINNHNNRRK